MILLSTEVFSSGLGNLLYSHSLLDIGQLHQLGNILAQNVTDPDILGQMQKAFQNFIESGQVWALLIGMVIGYVFRGFTAG